MSLLDKIEEVLNAIVLSENMEIVDIDIVSECGKKVIRVFLDKENGITLEDCSVMSSKMGTAIDETDLVRGDYILEVSSPGIDRVLKKEKDFVRFAGERVAITLFAPIDGQRKITGKIVHIVSGILTVSDFSGKIFVIPIDRIAKARLDPEL